MSNKPDSVSLSPSLTAAREQVIGPTIFIPGWLLPSFHKKEKVSLTLQAKAKFSVEWVDLSGSGLTLQSSLDYYCWRVTEIQSQVY